MINSSQHILLARHLTTSPSTLAAFRGGLALAPNKLSLGNAINVIPMPDELVFSVREPMVKLGDRVLAGQALAASAVASSSGVITKLHTCDAGTIITLKPDGMHTLSPAISQSKNAVEAIAAAGLKGLGGAGFSTFEKLQSQQQSQLNTLVINAAECEPVIACDEALMIEHANEIVSGVQTLMGITACQRCIIAIEDTMHEAVDAMKQALAAIDNRALQLSVIPTRYPGGAETVLLRQLTGAPLTKDKHPADLNLLCFNVATAYSVHHAVKRQPQFNRVVTIAGDSANEPCNVQALMGTPLTHILQHTNNIPSDGSSIRLGGPLSGNITTSDLRNTGIDARCNAIIIEQTKTPPNEQACIRCGDCADVCPEALQPQQLFRYQQNTDKLSDYRLNQCIECRCCDLVCPSSIALTDYFKQSKQLLAAHQRVQHDAELAEARFDAREQRLARKARERELELQAKKENAASTPKPGAMDIKAALARAANRAHKPGNKHS